MCVRECICPTKNGQRKEDKKRKRETKKKRERGKFRVGAEIERRDRGKKKVNF